MISIIDPTTEKVLALQNNRMIVIEGGTWEEYWEISHEDIKVEFIDEEIFIHSPASLDHEEIFGYLLTLFRNNVTENEGKVIGSRFPIKLKDGKRVEPDLMFLSNRDIEKGDLTKTVFEGSPSFIIEIVSPNYRKHDTERKLRKYKELGVKEYWILDPEFHELRQCLFEEQSLSVSQLYTEETVSPKISELSKIRVDLSKLWELIKAL